MYIHVHVSTCAGTNTVSNSFSKLKEAEQKLKKIVKDKLSYAVFHKDKEDVERLYHYQSPFVSLEYSFGHVSSHSTIIAFLVSLVTIPTCSDICVISMHHLL